jgi:hypothetical protein
MEIIPAVYGNEYTFEISDCGREEQLESETSRLKLPSCSVAPADHGGKLIGPGLRQADGALPLWKNGATIYP